MPTNSLAQFGPALYETIRKGFYQRPEEKQANRLAQLQTETLEYGLESKKKADVMARQKFSMEVMTKGANHVLSATPEQMPGRYAQVLQDMGKMGVDTSQMPQQFTPDVHEKLKMFREKAKPLSPAGKLARDVETGVLTQEQADLARKEPKERRIIKGAGGYQRFVDTGERVFPTSVKTEKGTTKTYRQEYDDGRVGLHNKEGAFLRYLTDKEGNPITTGVSERAKGVGVRAGVREKGIQARHAQKEVRLSVGQLTDDYRADRKKILEVSRSVTKVESLLAEPQTPARDLALQKEISQLFDTSSRAESEVGAWRNFGDLPTRLAGAISRFTTGEYVPEQIVELEQIVASLKNDLVVPSMREVDNIYTKQAKEFKIDPKLIIRKSVMPKWKIENGVMVETN